MVVPMTDRERLIERIATAIGPYVGCRHHSITRPSCNGCGDVAEVALDALLVADGDEPAYLLVPDDQRLTGVLHNWVPGSKRQDTCLNALRRLSVTAREDQQ